MLGLSAAAHKFTLISPPSPFSLSLSATTFQSEVDVFNALDIMHNSQFLEKLKFGIGDGHLQYYLYNWRAPEMQSKQVGLVLL